MDDASYNSIGEVECDPEKRAQGLVPSKVLCKFLHRGSHICNVAPEGWGTCGDAVFEMQNGGQQLCIWVDEVLEYQEDRRIPKLKGE